jgi:hypothetical protein
MPAPYRADGSLPPQNVPLLVRKWESPEALREGLQRYAQEEEEGKRVLTYAGLARVAGVESRTLRGYQAGEDSGLAPEWLAVLKEAAQLVEEQDERLIRSNTPVGGIFALKQRGWSDRLDVTSDGKGLAGISVFLDGQPRSDRSPDE